MAISLRRVWGQYPRQFWILFLGQLISSSGASLVWPFMTIYLRQKLEIPLTTVGLLLAVSSGTGLVSQFVLGPVVDRFGRKVAMMMGLANEVVVMVAFGFVDRLEAFAFLIALSGLIDPAFRIGLNAMVA
ncbi:MAG: MFS transporter, partial [Chloroflexota bacterium]|nr:MFS transporter [Chloroflexota bacterium]